jgi:phospholipid N-methyltransferase
MIFILRKSQLALFNMPVHVAGSYRKDGTYVKPHMRTARVAMKPHEQGHLFGVPPEAPAAAKKTPKLDAFLRKHGGEARMRSTLMEMRPEQRAKLIDAMAHIDELDPAHVTERLGMHAADLKSAEADDEKKDPNGKGGLITEKQVHERVRQDVEKQAPDVEETSAHEIVEHTTGKGKVLRGVVRKDLSGHEAAAIDPYTFRKDGGWFIREKHLSGAVPAAVSAPAAKYEPGEEEKRAENAAAVDRSKEQAAKLRAGGEKLKADAEADLGRDRLSNTARRARMAAGAEAEASKRLAIAGTMINLADAIEAGEARHLKGISTRAAVESLDASVRSAMYETDRNLPYVDQQRMKGRGPTPDDIRNAKIYRPTWGNGGADKPRLIEKLQGKRGAKPLIERLRASNGPDGAMVKELKKYLDDKDIRSGLGWWNDEQIKKVDRLARLGITNDHELRLALAEYLVFRDGVKKADPIKEAERALVGKKVGIDFFPTPKPLAAKMAEMAGVKPGMTVLEPSAGNGHLADAARDAGATVDAVEISDTLRNVLSAKGHNIAAHDFDTFEPGQQYDAVIMNPPFSDRKDAAHIMRAYNMLKPGGKLVAIAGEGVFFGSDQKAQAFRSWLDERGADVEKLPENTFKGSDLPSQTGANARLLVVTKPAEAAAEPVDNGPKEGDKKTEHGVEYVLRDGRWHRANEEEDDSRNAFTVQRVIDDKLSPVKFERGESVKVAGTFPMRTGEIKGISHDKREAKVDGVWYDFGYIYKQDYDEYAAPRAEIDKQVKTLSERLDAGNGIEAVQMLEDIEKQVKHFRLDQYKPEIDRLRQKIVEVDRQFQDRLTEDRARKQAQADDEARRVADEAAKAPKKVIRMTMDEWKKVHRDYKANYADGRVVMHGGQMVPVEIVKDPAMSSRGTPVEVSAAAPVMPTATNPDVELAEDREDLADELARDPHSEKAKALVRKVSERVAARDEPEEVDNPNSPNYRYADTGHIAGSRKEQAASQVITRAKKDGARVFATAIDWDDLEQNPREAKELITKSNLFGTVDWHALRDAGMTPGAGFLVDRIYASIAQEPGADTPQARQDYAIGLQSLRDRLEACKTPAEVTGVLDNLRDEFEGTILTAEESAQYQALGEQSRVLWDEARAIDAANDALYKEQIQARSHVYAIANEVEKRKRRGWAPKPEHDEQLARLRPIAEAADKAWGDALQASRPRKDELDRLRQELGGKREVIKLLAKVRNQTENPLHRAWNLMGDRFLGVVRYRSHKGSDAFANHVVAAKTGKVDWSWMEKEATRAPRVSKESARFQLQVADSSERIGGRAVVPESTAELKEMFNLRDVQSGNWVLRDVASAKFHTEQCAGAFADLADLLGAEDAQVSLNGRLAMAFGARGHGAKGWAEGAARAHYEPVQRVINLTKMGGGGSLAHEWFHALDNMAKEAEGGGASGKDDFITERPDLLPQGELRDAVTALRSAMFDGPHYAMNVETYSARDVQMAKHNIDSMTYPTTFATKIKAAGNVHDAVKAVETLGMAGVRGEPTPKQKKRIRDWRNLAIAYYGGNEGGGEIAVRSGKPMSSFALEARILDQGGKDYWAATHEMSARAFQSWVEDRLADKGRRNDYLSSYADNRYHFDPLTGMQWKPYPEGEERERINAAFDRFVAAVKSSNTLAKALEVIGAF